MTMRVTSSSHQCSLLRLLSVGPEGRVMTKVQPMPARIAVAQRASMGTLSRLIHSGNEIAMTIMIVANIFALVGMDPCSSQSRNPNKFSK